MEDIEVRFIVDLDSIRLFELIIIVILEREHVHVPRDLDI